MVRSEKQMSKKESLQERSAETRMHECASGGDRRKRKAASLFGEEVMYVMSLKTELWSGHIQCLFSKIERK